jgi:hypothetical protein
MMKEKMTIEKEIEKILYDLLQSVGIFLFTGVCLFGIFGLFGIFREQLEWSVTPIFFTLAFVASFFWSIYLYSKLKKIIKK